MILYPSTDQTKSWNFEDFCSQFQDTYLSSMATEPKSFAKAVRDSSSSKIILVSDEPSALKEAALASDGSPQVRTVLVTNGNNVPLEFKPSKILFQIQLLPVLLDSPADNPLLFDKPEPEFRVLYLYELDSGKFERKRQV